MAIDVRRPHDEQEIAAALALREEVFCGEPGVALEGDRDGLDGEALHLVAVGDGVVGTCRLLIEPGGSAKFGRLCVRASARGQGVGAALLHAAEREARAAGARRIGMHAQTDALGLYHRAGYTPYGERFDEEGIEHLGMEKHLP
jgi:predicted GNAT family N-acyltransferase